MELLSLNPGMFIWSVITFIAVVIVLRAVAWKPILEVVETREKTIRDALQRAESARAEAEKLMAEQQRQLNAVQDEIKALREESKKAAEKTAQQIVSEAQNEAAKLLKRAKEDIEKERQAALASLRKEVADMVVDATAKLVGVVVDKSQHQKLIDEAISTVGQRNVN
jgi:F-type H+-transporting ATPase subunit b